jgi:hypothetical protein
MSVRRSNRQTHTLSGLLTRSTKQTSAFYCLFCLLISIQILEKIKLSTRRELSFVQALLN